MRGVVLAAVLLAVAGCSDGEAKDAAPNPFGDRPPTSDVKVDTPQLRSMKAEAGIESCPDAGTGHEVAGGLPDITLPCLGGGPAVHLPALQGRPVVVNLWASWCSPCREELPLLQEYAEQADGRVDVVGVDFQDMHPEAALTLAQRSGVTYPLLADIDAELEEPLRTRGLPWTVILDADGRIAHILPGQIHSVEQLDDAVEDAVGVAAGG